MKIYSKQINCSILCIIFFFLLPVSIQAEEHEKNSGELEIKINRITEDRKNIENKETELERIFPELFEAETAEKIEQAKEAQKQDMLDLKEELFLGEQKEYSFLEETKDLLFTPEYDVVESYTAVDTDEQHSNWANRLLITGIVVFVCAVLGGCFALVRKLAN